MLDIITNNPYRVLGVLSNSPLKERIGNQNRLTAFAKVGKELTFPNDFINVIPEKPKRAQENISSANTALNLDKDQLKNALFWFISASPIDVIAIKHLQSGNKDKARELFEKKETFSTLLNVGVLQLIEADYSSGFSNISKVIHNSIYRTELLNALGLQNLTLKEDEISSLFITELLNEVPASTLLSAATNPTDKAIISKTALDEPISIINSAIATAKSANSRESKASLATGKKLVTSTKVALKQVKEIAGAKSSQYQMIADNLAKQILQCAIDYYNKASDYDVKAPLNAEKLLKYALQIAVGQLIKDRCQENYDIIKKAVENMPPAEVAIEARKVNDELRKFCSLPDKIEYSINLLNATKPLLQTIKTKLGATNSFYLSLSTQVVGNALHNLIEEVNVAQAKFGAMVEACKKQGINPSIVGSTLLDAIKPVLREAWRATTIMDTFDMEYDFKSNRYNQNRASLKGMCDDLNIPTYSSTSRPVSRPTTTPSSRSTFTSSTSSHTSNTSSSSSSNKEWYENGCLVAIIAWIVIGLIAGAICEANDGDFAAGFCISGVIVLFFSQIFSD